MEGSCGSWVKCETNDIIHHRRFYCTLDSKRFYLFHVWQSLDKWGIALNNMRLFLHLKSLFYFFGRRSRSFSVYQLCMTQYTHTLTFFTMLCLQVLTTTLKDLCCFSYFKYSISVVPNQIRSDVFSQLNANQLWAEQWWTENIQHSTHLLSPGKHANNCWVTGADVSTHQLQISDLHLLLLLLTCPEV